MSERKFRRRLERRAHELVAEIDQYFRDCAAWKARGHAIEPDPDGQLRQWRRHFAAMLRSVPREGVSRG